MKFRKRYGVGGHLFAIAIQKSVEYGFGGAVTGFAANDDLLKHYVKWFDADPIGILHPNHFIIEGLAARKVVSEYVYKWSDDKIFINVQMWDYPLKVTKGQQLFLQFVQEDAHYRKYWDAFFILFKTGMRISEFCGLTISDLDFENEIINIDHQLQRTRDRRVCRFFILGQE